MAHNLWFHPDTRRGQDVQRRQRARSTGSDTSYSTQRYLAMMKDRSGEVHGKLTIGWPAGYALRGKTRRVLYLCWCKCGNYAIISGNHIKNTWSCGCRQREIVTKHEHCRGGKKTPELSAYFAARARCTRPAHKDWKNYGARGIQFKFDSFEDFLAAVGEKPEPKHLYSLDRINNDTHYELGNVRWATRSEQRVNQRPHHWNKRPGSTTQPQEVFCAA